MKYVLCFSGSVGYFLPMLISQLQKPIYVGLILFMIFNSPICGLTVLCMSESGHMKLETALSSCCTEADLPVNQDDLGVVSDDSECGTCTDISFRLDSAHHCMARTISIAQAIPVWVAPGFLCVSMTPQAVKTPCCFIGLHDSPTLPVAGDTRLSSVIRC